MHLDELALNDYVDGALDEAALGAVEQHLSACAACRALVDDLREIRRTASALDPRDPPARAWSRIERAIRLEAGGARDGSGSGDSNRARRLQPGAAGVRPETRRSGASFGWLAAAAVLVLATAAGLYYGVARRSRPAPTQAAAPSAQAVEAELREAESHYEKAIEGLERIANAEQGAFDPATAAALQKNLAVIDQAIGESRAAIRTQPASEPARESLLENFKTKLALLQDTVALINEMRKGNEAGTARIISGLKEKS